MSAKKAKAEVETAGSRIGPVKRWLVIAGVVVAATAGVSLAVWQQVRGHVYQSAQYQIEPDRVAITPPPPWVKGDIRNEVIRDASVDGPLSLLDPQLTLRMATAFASHPWVAHVERVSKKYPSGLEAVLSYRRPVAIVEVQDGTGALPVDIEGVVLPTRGFTTEDAESYPRIGEVRTTPSGGAGVRWGDACVLGGAQIAAAVAKDWKELNLFRIVPAELKPGRTGAEYTFVLITHSGTRVNWGRAPSTGLPRELPAAEKVAQLKRYAAKNNGTLDGPNGPQQIRILQDGTLVEEARPKIQSLSEGEETPEEDVPSLRR